METGGFALVLKALDTELHDRPVIVKVLQEVSEDREYLAKKFSNEVKSLASLDHPGIVTPLDAGTLASGTPFIVLQYVRGVTLKETLQVGSIPLDRAADMFRQIGEALRAAHETGITHRDLKPSNIMMQPMRSGRDHVKLIDFGISSVGDVAGTQRSSTTRAIGTPPYMAPEQWSGKPVPASDVYALGIIAYEIVSGKQPFEWETLTELVRLQEAGIKRVPARERLDLHPEVGSLIVQALRPAPEERPASAWLFCNALADAMLKSRETENEQSATIPVPSPLEKAVDMDSRPAPPVSTPPKIPRIRLVMKWASRGSAGRPQSGRFTWTRLALSGVVFVVLVVAGALFMTTDTADSRKAQQPQGPPTPVPQTEASAPAPDQAKIAQAALDEGVRLDSSADYTGALDAFERALRANPESAEAYLARGNSYRKVKLYQKAVSDLERAIKFRPDYDAAYLSLGGALLNIHPPNYRDAISAFQKAVEINPKLAYAWHGIAFAQLRLGDPKSALGNADHAVRLDKGFLNAYRTRAEIYRKLGKAREAAADDRRYGDLDKLRRASAGRQ